MKYKIGGWLKHLDISRFLQWRINSYLMWILPFQVMQAYVAFLGRIYYFFNQRDYLKIRQIILHLLEKKDDDLDDHKIVKNVFSGIFLHYTEKLFVAYARFKRTCLFLKNNVKIEGQELLDRALGQGKGVILVTGHYGAVEFLPLVLALNDYTVTMLLRFKTSKLKRKLMKRSYGVPITLVDVDDGKGALYKALKALRSNQIIITECDEFEKWRPCKHRSNQFLGRRVPFDRTLDMIQRRSKAQAIMGMVQREEENHYRLKLHSLNDPKPNKAKSPTSQLALTVLEEYIKKAPHQWYQWKEAELILGPDKKEEYLPEHATEDDRYLPLEDTPVHAF